MKSHKIYVQLSLEEELGAEGNKGRGWGVTWIKNIVQCSFLTKRTEEWKTFATPNYSSWISCPNAMLWLKIMRKDPVTVRVSSDETPCPSFVSHGHHHHISARALFCRSPPRTGSSRMPYFSPPRGGSRIFLLSRSHRIFTPTSNPPPFSQVIKKPPPQLALFF